MISYKNEMNRVTKVISAVSLFLPLLASAQYGTIDDLLRRLCVVVGYVFAVLIFLAIVFVIYAAFLYLTAAGDPEKVKKANATILYAAIGIAIAILAKFLPSIVAGLMGTSVNPYGSSGFTGC